MERRFLVEAKAFRLLANEGPSDFRLEERRKGFVGVIFVGYEGSAWLVDRVDEVIKSPMKEDFVKCPLEDHLNFVLRRHFILIQL
jgi:hypothetical protein